MIEAIALSALDSTMPISISLAMSLAFFSLRECHSSACLLVLLEHGGELVKTDFAVASRIYLNDDDIDVLL